MGKKEYEDQSLLLHRSYLFYFLFKMSGVECEMTNEVRYMEVEGFNKRT